VAIPDASSQACKEYTRAALEVQYDPATKMLVIARSSSECPSQESPSSIPQWPYTVKDFYGFRGEKPFYAKFERADYSGFAALPCLALTIKFNADAPSHLAPGWLKLVPNLSNLDVPQVAALRIQIPNNSGQLVAATWRDNANHTFAVDGSVEAHVPLPRTLRQTRFGEVCTFRCWQSISVKVATSSGQHALAIVDIDTSSILLGYVAVVKYYSYTLGNMQRSTSKITAPPPVLSTLQRLGISMSGSKAGQTKVDLEIASPRVFMEGDFSGRIGRQWSISTKLMV
jgi:hypothetical protein